MITRDPTTDPATYSTYHRTDAPRTISAGVCLVQWVIVGIGIEVEARHAFAAARSGFPIRKNGLSLDNEDAIPPVRTKNP
jgi:hypothetical protein